MKNSSSSSTQRKCAFARKCARLVKEQRARFYILRRLHINPFVLPITQRKLKGSHKKCA
ncbi:hypothetical protein JHK85_043896 [Glycine max]|nr:hypothetical protein JHK85_043896 [Glycine max]